MRHVTRIVRIALVLALGTVPGWAADATRGTTGTSAETTPILRAVDSAAIVSGSAGDDLSLIHPWDNPQRSDSTHSERHRTLDLESPAAGKAGAIKPTGIDAVRNYPNPFNAQTTIEVRLEAGGPVEVALFNLLGQSVRTVEFGRLESGTQSWTWDGMLEGGRPAPSGIYFYRVSSGAFSALQKMVLLK